MEIFLLREAQRRNQHEIDKYQPYIDPNNSRQFSIEKTLSTNEESPHLWKSPVELSILYLLVGACLLLHNSLLV